MEMQNYESILNKIDEEHKEYESMQKESAKLANYIGVLKILKNTTFTQNKLFQIRAKLFDSTFSIYETFSDRITTQELENLTRNHNGSTLYYIEVFISRVFHEKLITQNWIITISVVDKHGFVKVNRSLNVRNRISNPITVVVPFTGQLENSCVEAYLISPENENFWPQMKLASIPIDVSYKFKIQPEFKTIENDVLNINKIYNETSFTPKLLKYEFRCEWSKQQFVERIFQNCYHVVNVTKVLDNSNVLTANLSIDGVPFTVELNCLTMKLKLEAMEFDLAMLKKYFRQFTTKYTKKDFNKLQRSAVLDEMKIDADSSSFVTLSGVYDGYKKFVSNYPL